MNFVEILIMGKKYRVPSNLTVQKAVEYVGFQIIRGCGCRGGVCGACAMVYRTPESYKIKTGLACMRLVENMMILNIPYFPVNKAIYDIENLEAKAYTNFAIYPEIARCVDCNMCTKMCPQDIQVMEVVAASQKADIQKAAELSSKCVMCGLCVARCTGELAPNLVALLCRRLYGKYMLPPYPHVVRHVKEIESGEYDEQMENLLKLSEEELREEYIKAQADKQIIQFNFTQQAPHILNNYWGYWFQKA